MTRLLWVGLVVGLCCGFSHSALASNLRTVALAGDFPAGTPRALPVNFLGLTGINDLGHVTFVSLDEDTLDPLGLTRVWTEESDKLRLVISEGDPAPLPDGGIEFGFVGSVPTNETGQTLIGAQLTGAGADNRFTAWTEDAGLLRLVARGGSQVPGFPEGVVYEPRIVAHEFNSAGQALLSAAITGPGVDANGVFLGNADTLRLVAQRGVQAPAMPPGVNILTVVPPIITSSFGKALNDAGQSVLNAQLTEDGTSLSGNAIYVEDAGSFRLVVNTGDPALGTPDGVVYSFFDAFGIDEAGQAAFNGFLEGPGIDGTNNFGIWKETGNIASLVARAGDPAPGTEPGVTFPGPFGGGLTRMTLGGGGHVAFTSGLTGPGVMSGSGGIWSDTSGSLEPIALVGEPAPGTANGVHFQGFTLGLVNDTGQISFKGFVTGEDVDNTNNQGIWVSDPNGDLQLIVRTGDELEVAPDVFRTVDDLVFGGTFVDEGRTGLNARGEMAFNAIFTDGTLGIFVSNLATGMVDQTPPELVSSSNSDILWPPNHTMAEIPVQLQASDDQTPIVELGETLVVTVSSNELDSRNNGDPSGDVHGFDGFTAPVDLSDLFALNEETGLIEGTINLRSERFGFGDGRIYSLEATIADATGNESSLLLDFPVPHDLGAVKAVPEPSASVLFVISVCAFFGVMRQTRGSKPTTGVLDDESTTLG